MAIIAFRVGRRVWRTGTGDRGFAALFAKEKGHPVKDGPLCTRFMCYPQWQALPSLRLTSDPASVLHY